MCLGGVTGPEGWAAASATGWRPLFNGRDLDDWDFFQEGVGDVDRDHVFAVEHGMVHVLGPAYRGGDRAGFGHIATREVFGDYHLRLEYRWGHRRYAPRTLAKRNSGILYHMAETRGVVWPDCVEFQIEETDTGDAVMTGTRALVGESLGGTPAWPHQPAWAEHTYPQTRRSGGYTRQFAKKMGDFENLNGWNVVVVIAVGQQAAHLVNGRIVTTLFDLETPVLTDMTNFVPLTCGRIGLEAESAEMGTPDGNQAFG